MVLLDWVPCFILDDASHWLCCVAIWIVIGYGVMHVASEVIVTKNATSVVLLNLIVLGITCCLILKL